MRVLHLVEYAGPAFRRGTRSAGDLGALACASLIRGIPECEHEAVLIGPTSAEDRAAACGLRTTDRITAVLGAPEGAWRGLASWLDDRGGFDVVHATGVGGYRAARLAGVGARRIVMTDVSGGSAPDMRAVTARWARGARIVALTREDERAWREAGAFVRLAGGPRFAEGGNRTDRASRGVGDGVPVVALAGEEADALRFVFLMGMLEIRGRQVIGVMREDARQSARALRFVRMSRLGTRIVLSGRSLPEMLGVADAVVWDGGASRRAGGIVTAGLARAMGVACVPDVEGVLGDGFRASLPLPELARRLADVLDGAGTDAAPREREGAAYEAAVREAWEEASATRGRAA